MLRDEAERVMGASVVSRVITVRRVMLCTSTIGEAAATVIVSSIPRTLMSAFTVAVKSDVSWLLSADRRE